MPQQRNKRPATDGIGAIGRGEYVSDNREFGFDEDGLHIPTGNSELVLSRRQLLYGAAGLAGLGVVGGAASVISSQAQDDAATDALEVAENEVFTLDDCTETPVEDALELIGEYSLPYGTLLWAGNDTMAACLLPTETANPLVQAALLNLTSGYYGIIMEQADGHDEGYEIFDLRASDEGAIWVEANILARTWRVYVSTIYDMGLEEHHLVDEGDARTEMPTLAAIGDTAFWQVMPAPAETVEQSLQALQAQQGAQNALDLQAGTAVEENDEEPAEETEELPDQTVVKKVAFRKPAEVKTIFTCEGRCATALQPANALKGVVVTPANEEAPSQRQLVALDGAGEIADLITLPSRMKPLEACYGSTGFAFSFEDIYNYGEGIANLGTYTPQQKPESSEYSHRPWFRFARTPSIPPAWCNEWFLVKSTSAVVAIHPADQRYVVLPTDNNAEVYGDCLGSIGQNKTVVTYTNIDRTQAVQENEEVTEYDRQCLVRVWTTP